MSKRKTINLDASNRKYTKDGIDDFFYPTSRESHLDFSISLIKAYCKVINKHKDNEDIDLYKIFAKYYIAELISVFQGLQLKKGLEQSGYDYKIPSEWRSWPAILEGKPPRMPPYITALQAKPKKPNYIKKVFRPSFLKRLLRGASLKNGGMSVGSLKIKPITDDVLKNDIIATQRTSLISRHAEEVQGDVVFCNSSKWFHAIDIENWEQNYQFSQIDKEILELSKDIMEKHDIVVDTDLYNFFSNIIRNSIPYFRFYIKCLHEKNNLPHVLWIGTSGNIWDSLLKVAVKQKGGYVCGHDHGTGHAHFKTPTMGVIELWGSDEFYTFSRELEKAAEPWSLMQSNRVKITEPSQTKETQSKFTKVSDNVHNIFLLSTVYEKDRGRLHPLMPDIVQLDWQARFISFMRDENYTVTIKSHPESSFNTPDSFKNTLGAHINSDRFEDVFKTADLFIFDYICTSTFTEALKTNIPIIIVDFGDIPWTYKGLELVAKRCALIEGISDQENRLQIDWDCFNDEIKNAIERSYNQEFYQHYYK